MAVISWGKPRILIQSLDAGNNAPWIEVPTPVQESTQLTTTKGDKQEAKIEGGENEDVRYNANSYALAFNVRAAKGRKHPVKDNDGIVPGNYALALIPEDPSVPGFVFQKSVLSVEDAYTATDGATWNYTVDAIKKDKDTPQIQWGVINLTESDGNISKVECDPVDTDGDSDKFTVGNFNPPAPSK